MTAGFRFSASLSLLNPFHQDISFDGGKMLLTSQAKANRTLIRNKKRYLFAIRNFTLFQNTHKESFVYLYIIAVIVLFLSCLWSQTDNRISPKLEVEGHVLGSAADVCDNTQV